jgi:hypothetical protein
VIHAFDAKTGKELRTFARRRCSGHADDHQAATAACRHHVRRAAGSSVIPRPTTAASWLARVIGQQRQKAGRKEPRAEGKSEGKDAGGKPKAG